MSGWLAFARRLGEVLHHETDDGHEDSFSLDDDEAEMQ